MALSDISLRHGNSVAFGAKPTSSDFRCAPNLHAFDPDLHDSRLVSRSDVAEAELFDPPETSRNRNGHQQTARRIPYAGYERGLGSTRRLSIGYPAENPYP